MLQLAAGLLVALVLVVALAVVPSRALAAEPKTPKNASPTPASASSTAPNATYQKFKFWYAEGPIMLKGADCGNVVVEAFNGAGVQVASTHAVVDATGACRYSLRLPADETVGLVARKAGGTDFKNPNSHLQKIDPASKGSYQWIKASFDAKGEAQKTVPLTVVP